MTSSIAHDLSQGRFWRHLTTNTLASGGAIGAFISLTAAFFPAYITSNVAWLIPLTCLIAIVFGVLKSWPRPIEQSYNLPNVKISIIKGDILQQSDDHLVIGMSTTFDTKVPNIIASTSLQAQFLNKQYNNDIDRLNQDLDAALSGVSPAGRINKSGKKIVYPMGTVAVLDGQNKHYFCVAYTSMNTHNVASSGIGDVWVGLESLWEAVSAHANGESVAITAIGGGQSRLTQVLPLQDSVRLIILSYMFRSRKGKVCDELKIVLRPQEYNKLDRLELQSFLKSLRAS